LDSRLTRFLRANRHALRLKTLSATHPTTSFTHFPKIESRCDEVVTGAGVVHITAQSRSGGSGANPEDQSGVHDG